MLSDGEPAPGLFTSQGFPYRLGPFCCSPHPRRQVRADAAVRFVDLPPSALKYDKGILADILEVSHSLKADSLSLCLQPIMGKGLIPADLPTWQPRRRAVVPGFHSSWLQSMVSKRKDDPHLPALMPLLLILLLSPFLLSWLSSATDGRSASLLGARTGW
eukprot:665948-Hanusia_phi.AAC.2